MTLLAGVETGHVVHFYDHEETLALAVADFLGVGLAEGGTALVVATPGHSSAISRVLESAGIDVAEARAAQQYVELDAQELLSRFTVSGAIDSALFQQAVSPLIETLSHGLRPLRVYGEMVDLLWRQGDVQAAHDLEVLWNSIGAGTEFGLFCGYSSTVVDGAQENGRPLVAEHHDAVFPDRYEATPGEVSRRFESTLFAAAAARRFTGEVLQSWGLAQVLPEVELVVSELATNAVVHTAGRFSVTLSRGEGGRVRVEVHDASPDAPVVRDAAPDATNGRGLLIVSAVAQDWGITNERDGKTVWALVAPRPGHS